MDIIAKYKVPMLVAIAMTPDSEPKFKENPEKYKYLFRLCVSSKHLMMYLSGVMRFINEEYGFNKVHIFNQDVAWARAVAGGMTKVYFEKAGWTIVGQESYPVGTGDFSTGLMKAQSGGAQVIMPIFDMVETNVLIKQWKSMRVNALFAGFTSRMGIPEAWKNCDGKIGGAMEAIYELGSAIGSPKVPGSMEFQATFDKRWGYPSGTGGHGAGPAYESVKILTEAIERAGLQRAVDRAGGPAFGLHLDDVRDVAPDVLATLRRPLVGELAHVGGGRDGVDGADIIDAMGDRRGRFIAVDHYGPSLCHGKPPRAVPQGRPGCTGGSAHAATSHVNKFTMRRINLTGFPGKFGAEGARAALQRLRRTRHGALNPGSCRACGRARR